MVTFSGFKKEMASCGWRNVLYWGECSVFALLLLLLQVAFTLYSCVGARKSVHICKGIFCLYTPAKGFSACIHLKIVFLLVYIYKCLFCLYIIARNFSVSVHLQRAFLPERNCKGPFCLHTFANCFSTRRHLQRANLPVYISKGLFCPYTLSHCLATSALCSACVIVACFICWVSYVHCVML